MEFSLLLNQLKDLDLPKGEYLVVASGSLAAHGIREANDFDVLVTEKLWEELSQKYPIELAESGKVENINLGDIQILCKQSFYWNPRIASIDELIKTADTFQGEPFINLDYLKIFKAKLGREKDLKDVILIESYLNTSS